MRVKRRRAVLGSFWGEGQATRALLLFPPDAASRDPRILGFGSVARLAVIRPQSSRADTVGGRTLSCLPLPAVRPPNSPSPGKSAASAKTCDLEVVFLLPWTARRDPRAFQKCRPKARTSLRWSLRSLIARRGGGLPP